LADQERARWDRGKIDEGVRTLDRAIASRHPGPYQLQAAIAACHATVPTAADTDWVQIAALYQALAHHDPCPVVQANRAVAVAMSQGAAAGLAILDQLSSDPRVQGWHLLPAAKAELLRRLRRVDEAADAYRAALALAPPPAERDFLARRLDELTSPDSV
jgi:RNA polymerase sigma-70 factor (ECF subfamily)